MNIQSETKVKAQKRYAQTYQKNKSRFILADLKKIQNVFQISSKLTISENQFFKILAALHFDKQSEGGVQSTLLLDVGYLHTCKKFNDIGKN